MSGAQGAAAPRRLAALVRAAQRAAGVPNFAPVLLPGEQVCGSRCGSQYALPEAAAWVLGGRLTPQAVAAAAPGAAITIKRSPDPLFMYTEVGVPDRLKDGAGVGSRTEFVNMAPADFVRACQLQDGQNPPFHYYTAGVEQHAAGFAEKACPGWECLVVDERACNQRHAAPAHSSLWVGGNGSTTQAHYDVLHNVFVQVHGRKRFRLWGPEMHTPLRVFPDAHPRARKAQILIDDEANKVPEPYMDVVLHAGDALYIPAFWFHHVQALTMSVSVNVFSENSIKLAAQEILMRPPPPSLRHSW